MLYLGLIWYHSEPSDVPYSQNLPRPISWFGLYLQQNDSSLEPEIQILNGIYPASAPTATPTPGHHMHEMTLLEITTQVY